MNTEPTNLELAILERVQKPDNERSTPDLLNELHSLRCQHIHPNWDIPFFVQIDAARKLVRETRMAELRAVLATREHIVRPAEKKQARKEAARINRGQGKSKNR